MMIRGSFRFLATGLSWIDLIFQGGHGLHNLKSRILLAADRPADALQAALDGMEVAPENAELHYRAGRAAIAMMKYRYARARMAYAVALSPTNYAFRFGLAYTAQRCGELEVALREYGLVLEHAPQDLSARLNLSLVHKTQGSYGAALAGFEQVIESKPNEEKALYGAAVCAHRLGDGQRAQHWAERCIGFNEKHHKAHLLLGTIAIDRGDLSRAEVHFQDARYLNPDNGRALAALGRLHIKEDLARGRHLLREALLVSEPDTTAHFDLAQYYEKRRQLRDALAEYALYIRYHSGARAEWAKQRRVRLYEKLNDMEKTSP